MERVRGCSFVGRKISAKPVTGSDRGPPRGGKCGKMKIHARRNSVNLRQLANKATHSLLYGQSSHLQSHYRRNYSVSRLDSSIFRVISEFCAVYTEFTGMKTFLKWPLREKLSRET